MGISVFKNGITKPCRVNTWREGFKGDLIEEHACPFCNLILHCYAMDVWVRQDRRCNCGGSVSIDGKETQAEKTFKAQSNSETSYKTNTENSTKQEIVQKE